MRQTSLTLLVIASLLAVSMVGTTAEPVSAASKRFQASERLAFKLVNCIRTGGRVLKGGKCKGYGSGRYSAKRAPLKRSHRVSNKVAWPWARRIAKHNLCGHSLAGSTVDSRFRSAGLRHRDNGENVGCGGRSWSSRRMVIWSIRMWQSEKRYGGWHWRQLMDRDFKVAGIGVAKHWSGRTRLVVNFYGRSVR